MPTDATNRGPAFPEVRYRVEKIAGGLHPAIIDKLRREEEARRRAEEGRRTYREPFLPGPDQPKSPNKSEDGEVPSRFGNTFVPES